MAVRLDAAAGLASYALLGELDRDVADEGVVRLLERAQDFLKQVAS